MPMSSEESTTARPLTGDEELAGWTAPDLITPYDVNVITKKKTASEDEKPAQR